MSFTALQWWHMAQSAVHWCNWQHCIGATYSAMYLCHISEHYCHLSINWVDWCDMSSVQCTDVTCQWVSAMTMTMIYCKCVRQCTALMSRVTECIMSLSVSAVHWSIMSTSHSDVTILQLISGLYVLMVWAVFGLIFHSGYSLISGVHFCSLCHRIPEIQVTWNNWLSELQMTPLFKKEFFIIILTKISRCSFVWTWGTN